MANSTVQIKRNANNSFDIANCNIKLKAGEQFYDSVSGSIVIGDGDDANGHTIGELWADGKAFTSPDGSVPASSAQVKSLYTFTYNDDTLEASVSNYTGVSTNPDAIVPAYVAHNGLLYTVYRIDNGCFRVSGSTIPTTDPSIQSVSIPSTVREIGQLAFRGCRMSQITLPNSINRIQYGAFMGCTGITSISIGDGVASIPTDAFGYCTALETVELPDTIKSIGDQAFEHCTSLEGVVLPASVETIGQDAFSFCSSLTTIEIKNYDGRVSGSPWGATGAAISWIPEERYVEQAKNAINAQSLSLFSGDDGYIEYVANSHQLERNKLYSILYAGDEVLNFGINYVAAGHNTAVSYEGITPYIVSFSIIDDEVYADVYKNPHTAGSGGTWDSVALDSTHKLYFKLMH